MGIFSKIAGAASGIDPKAAGATLGKAAEELAGLKFTGEQQAEHSEKRAKILAGIDKVQAELSGAGKAASWRNAMGWTCVWCFAIMFAVNPFIGMVVTTLADTGLLGISQDQIESIKENREEFYDGELVAAFMPVLLGMLGLGSMRSFDKRQTVGGANRKNARAAMKMRRKLIRSGMSEEDAEAFLDDWL